jgi:hypothetical protein
MEATPDAPASTYIDVMAECEILADEILDFPDGLRRYPGGLRDALALPHGMEQGSRDDLLPCAVAKRIFLSCMLARLKGPVAGQAPPAAVSATPPLPTVSATPPLPTAAPTTAWPAEQFYTTLSANFPYPLLPPSLINARQTQPKDGQAQRTSSDLFWKCCFQEILYEREPLGNSDLLRLFGQRCAALSPGTQPTHGHEQWLKRQSDFLLVLYRAAGVRVTVQHPRAMTILKTTCRRRGKEIL